MTLEWVIRASAWVIVAGWFGSFSLFAFVIAPTAFQVLPSQAAAGALVGPVLATLHSFGMLAGMALGGLGAAMRRGWLVIALPLALAAACGVSEYWVTPAIGEVQPAAFGENQQSAAAEHFSYLHQTSRYLFGIIQFGTLGLILAYARPSGESPQARA